MSMTQVFAAGKTRTTIIAAYLVGKLGACTSNLDGAMKMRGYREFLFGTCNTSRGIQLQYMLYLLGYVQKKLAQ